MKTITTRPIQTNLLQVLFTPLILSFGLILSTNNTFAQCASFFDDFESGSYTPTWSVGPGLTSTSVTNSNVAEGTYSVTGTGGTNNHLDGFSTTVSNLTPSEISYYMYTEGTTSSINYTVMGENPSAQDCIFFNYWKGSDGNIRFVSSIDYDYAASPDTWYFIELKNIDWTNKTFDIYIDGALQTTGFPFRDNNQNSINEIHLYNWGSGTGYWDRIQLGLSNDNTAPEADVANLPNVEEECEVTTLTAPTATDNCDGSILGTHNAVFPVTSNTTVTWTYEDASGNVATQTQDIVIDDITAPALDSTNLADKEVYCEIDSIAPPTATDNCDGSITATTSASFPITQTTTITWDYVDASGNAATQTQEVIITKPNTDVTIDEPMLIADNDSANVSYQWIKCDGTVIDGATDSTFTPEENGDYAVIITENNCTDTSTCYPITTLELSSENEHSIQIFPNPSNGQFTVKKTGDAAPAPFVIRDAQGRQIKTGELVKQQSVIDVSTAKPGVYFLIMNEETRRIVIK
ncbi:MAG: T9SS type A sorting domain-containing protein [Bacteroidota bacterium]